MLDFSLCLTRQMSDEVVLVDDGFVSFFVVADDDMFVAVFVDILFFDEDFAVFVGFFFENCEFVFALVRVFFEFGIAFSLVAFRARKVQRYGDCDCKHHETV